MNEDALKILKELESKKIVSKTEKKYSLKSEFIEYIKKLSDEMLKNHTFQFINKNKLDLYNALVTLYPNDDIRNRIDQLLDEWLIDKLHKWYSSFYDPEGKEYSKIKDIIIQSFNSYNLNILEVGCGTGRITVKLARDFHKVKAIDVENRFINFCKKNYNLNNCSFETANISDFNSKEKFDVIIFSWTGLHYQRNIDKIIENVKKLLNKKSLIIILDAYYDTEYIEKFFKR